MARKSAAEAAAAWSQNLGASSANIEAGVAAVTVSPGAAAARQADLWLRKIQASQGKWKANVSKVSTADWQEAMRTKGIPRIASGATAAQPKMEAFLASFLPHMDAVVASLPPRGDIEANINRMVATVRGAAKYSKR